MAENRRLPSGSSAVLKGPILMKKVPIAVLAVLLTAAVILFLLAHAWTETRDKTVAIHTAFLFGQIGHEEMLPNTLSRMLSPTGYWVDGWRELTSQQYGILAEALRKAPIDWNSCSLDGNAILDGWKQKCIVEIRGIPGPAHPTIRLVSLGKDGIRNTNDDIVREIILPGH
jgi:hypothetical protein